MRGGGGIQAVAQAGILVGQPPCDGDKPVDPLAKVKQFLFHPAMLGSGYRGVKSA